MGARAPEAGVWVIAETTELPTPLRKIVVTDDQGRYLVPDLPKANYDVWVRGYGLVDSAKTKVAPGKQVNLTAVPAPNAKAAAEYYPAQYWLSLLRVPPKSDFPGTGPTGNGIATNDQEPGRVDPQRRQHRRLHRLPSDGQQGHARDPQGARHVRERGGGMGAARAVGPGRRRHARRASTRPARRAQLAMWGDWTDRIAAGALPATAPPRPQGRERNVVITMWDWADPKAYLHDEIASDKRNPTVNANGPVYGAMEESRRLHAGGGAEDQRRRAGAAAGARSEDAAARAAHAAVARTGARSRSGRRRARRTASRWTARAACGWRRGSGRTRRPSSAARGPAIRRRRCSRSSRAAARCRCTTRRPRRSRPSTPASARTT